MSSSGSSKETFSWGEKKAIRDQKRAELKKRQELAKKIFLKKAQPYFEDYDRIKKRLKGGKLDTSSYERSRLESEYYVKFKQDDPEILTDLLGDEYWSCKQQSRLGNYNAISQMLDNFLKQNKVLAGRRSHRNKMMLKKAAWRQDFMEMVRSENYKENTPYLVSIRESDQIINEIYDKEHVSASAIWSHPLSKECSHSPELYTFKSTIGMVIDLNQVTIKHWERYATATHGKVPKFSADSKTTFATKKELAERVISYGNVSSTQVPSAKYNPIDKSLTQGPLFFESLAERSLYKAKKLQFKDFRSSRDKIQTQTQVGEDLYDEFLIDPNSIKIAGIMVVDDASCPPLNVIEVKGCLEAHQGAKFFVYDRTVASSMVEFDRDVALSVLEGCDSLEIEYSELYDKLMIKQHGIVSNDKDALEEVKWHQKHQAFSKAMDRLFKLDSQRATGLIDEIMKLDSDIGFNEYCQINGLDGYEVLSVEEKNGLIDRLFPGDDRDELLASAYSVFLGHAANIETERKLQNLESSFIISSMKLEDIFSKNAASVADAVENIQALNFDDNKESAKFLLESIAQQAQLNKMPAWSYTPKRASAVEKDNDKKQRTHALVKKLLPEGYGQLERESKAKNNNGIAFSSPDDPCAFRYKKRLFGLGLKMQRATPKIKRSSAVKRSNHQQKAEEWAGNIVIQPDAQVSDQEASDVVSIRSDTSNYDPTADPIVASRPLTTVSRPLTTASRPPATASRPPATVVQQRAINLIDSSQLQSVIEDLNLQLSSIDPEHGGRAASHFKITKPADKSSKQEASIELRLSPDSKVWEFKRAEDKDFSTDIKRLEGKFGSDIAKEIVNKITSKSNSIC